MSEIDLSAVGSDSFPNNVNDVMDLVETIARQNIRAVKSANRLDDAVYRYEVDHGKVIQEALIAKAASYAFDKDAYSRAPSDPTVYAKYFDNYGARQFETTTRVNDIRKIIADKGVGVEDVVSEIISTLTTGDGYEDFIAVRNLLFNQYIPDYTTILGGVPKNIRGAIYAARDMYNHLLNDNDDLTAGAGTGAAFVSSTPREDIRVAMTDKMLNLMDVAELAHVFNLSKEELFGKLVIVPADAGNQADWYKIVVYDRKAMGRATRLFEFTQEEVARGLYFNHYLTTDRAYFFNDLFKSAIIDCSVAAQSALNDLVVAPFDITVNVSNGTSEGDAQILLGKQAQVTLAASEGYVLPQSITVTGADHTYNPTTGVVVLSNPTDDITITCACLAVYAITVSVTDGDSEGDSEIVQGGTASVTLSADSGYHLPASITVSGASYTYDSTTGVVSLSAPTGNVSIACVCEQDQPAPSLTPFAVGQTIRGLDFGNVQNGDTSSAIESMLSSLPYSGGDCNLLESVVGEDENYPMLANYIEDVGYMISAGDDYVYSTFEDSAHGIQRGFQGLVNGKLIFDTSYEITAIGQSNIWNDGSIIGAVVAEPAGGLTPFSGTQSVTGIEVSTNGLPTSSIDSWLASLDNHSDTRQLVQFVAVEGNSVCYAENGFDSGPLFGHFTLWIMTASGLIVYNPSQISGSGLPTINAGWYITDYQLSSFTPISGDNEYSFGTSVQTTVVSENAQAFSTINGVVVGAVLAE